MTVAKTRFCSPLGDAECQSDEDWARALMGVELPDDAPFYASATGVGRFAYVSRHLADLTCTMDDSLVTRQAVEAHSLRRGEGLVW